MHDMIAKTGDFANSSILRNCIREVVRIPHYSLRMRPAKVPMMS